MKAKVNKVTIEIVQTDMLSLDVDGLVNETDPNLSITEELEERAGPTLAQECKMVGWCEVGSATVTNAGDLPFKKIIHAVGPRWGEGSERGKLAKATWAALQCAEDEELKSIAIPSISTGAHGYPVENCAMTMLAEIIDFTFEKLRHLRNVTLCVKTEIEFEVFVSEFQRQIENLKDRGEGKVRA